MVYTVKIVFVFTVFPYAYCYTMVLFVLLLFSVRILLHYGIVCILFSVCLVMYGCMVYPAIARTVNMFISLDFSFVLLYIALLFFVFVRVICVFSVIDRGFPPLFIFLIFILYIYPPPKNFFLEKSQ